MQIYLLSCLHQSLPIPSAVSPSLLRLPLLSAIKINNQSNSWFLEWREWSLGKHIWPWGEGQILFLGHRCVSSIYTINNCCPVSKKPPCIPCVYPSPHTENPVCCFISSVPQHTESSLELPDHCQHTTPKQSSRFICPWPCFNIPLRLYIHDMGFWSYLNLFSPLWLFTIYYWIYLFSFF